jgi:hypothetical protein
VIKGFAHKRHFEVRQRCAASRAQIGELGTTSCPKGMHNGQTNALALPIAGWSGEGL